MRLLKQSATRNVMVFLTDSADHITGKAGLTPTISASKDGGAFAAITPTVADRGSGWYNLALTAAHTDTLGDLVLHVTAAGADPTDVAMRIVAVDYTDAVRFGLSALPNAPAAAAGGLPTIGTGAGQIGLSAGAVTAGTVIDKTGYALTAGERTAIANEVEAQIIDETDAERVLTAITDKIASVNPSLAGLTIAAIASGVWSNATRILTAGTNIVLDKGTGITGFNDVTAAEVWTATDRTLTAFGFSVTAASVTDKVGYSLAVAPPTAPEIDAQLSTAHGPGAWDATGGGITITDVQTALTNQGYTTGRAANLDAIGAPVLVADKTGFILDPAGLDAIQTAPPTGPATTFREMVVMIYRRFFMRATRSATEIRTYADNGVTTITTQPISTTGTDETQGAAT
jgi:hypothetical protein